MSDAPAAPSGQVPEGRSVPVAAPPRIDGAVITSLLAALGFLLALAIGGAIAWLKGDFTMLVGLGSVAATNMTTVVSYWVGSSARAPAAAIPPRGSVP